MDEGAKREFEELAAFKDATTRMAENMQRVSFQAIEFLTLTNGGAAVACLAYMGSEGRWHNAETLRFLLVLFLLGLLLAGVIVSRGYSYAHRQTLALLKDGFDVATGGIRAGQVLVNYRLRVLAGNPLQFLESQRRIGILSFICFAVGILVVTVWMSQVAFNGPLVAAKPPGH